MKIDTRTQLQKFDECMDAIEHTENVKADEMKIAFLASIAESLAIIADHLQSKTK